MTRPSFTFNQVDFSTRLATQKFMGYAQCRATFSRSGGEKEEREGGKKDRSEGRDAKRINYDYTGGQHAPPRSAARRGRNSITDAGRFRAFRLPFSSASLSVPRPIPQQSPIRAKTSAYIWANDSQPRSTFRHDALPAIYLRAAITIHTAMTRPVYSLITRRPRSAFQRRQGRAERPAAPVSDGVNRSALRPINGAASFSHTLAHGDCFAVCSRHLTDPHRYLSSR